MDLNRSRSSCKPFDHLEFKECDYDIKVHFISFVFWPNWKWFCKSIVTIVSVYAMQWTTEIETQIDKFSNSFDFVCQPVSQFSSHLLILYSHWDLFIHEFNLFIQKCFGYSSLNLIFSVLFSRPFYSNNPRWFESDLIFRFTYVRI